MKLPLNTVIYLNMRLSHIILIMISFIAEPTTEPPVIVTEMPGK